MYYQQASHGLARASHGLARALLLQTVMNSSVAGKELFTDNFPEDRREGVKAHLHLCFFALLAFLHLENIGFIYETSRV